jgi:hypothetical protein
VRVSALITPVLSAVAGIVVLAAALALDEPVSMGSLLGVLLLLSAALRFALARRA